MPATQTPMRLYRNRFSGHAHRCELLLAFLDLQVEMIDVDIEKGEHKQPAYLAKNPFGVVPVLEDGELTIADSCAILVYLALKHDAGRTWYPQEPAVAAQVQRWLSVSAGALFQGPAGARAQKLFNAPFDHAKAHATAEHLFDVLERHMVGRDYFAAAWPTIADLALYSYTAHAPEGGVSLEPYPHLRQWLSRIERLQGFCGMSRLHSPG
jgi:glutathione S-transferase